MIAARFRIVLLVWRCALRRASGAKMYFSDFRIVVCKKPSRSTTLNGVPRSWLFVGLERRDHLRHAVFCRKQWIESRILREAPLSAGVQTKS